MIATAPISSRSAGFVTPDRLTVLRVASPVPSVERDPRVRRVRSTAVRVSCSDVPFHNAPEGEGLADGLASDLVRR